MTFLHDFHLTFVRDPFFYVGLRNDAPTFFVCRSSLRPPIYEYLGGRQRHQFWRFRSSNASTRGTSASAVSQLLPVGDGQQQASPEQCGFALTAHAAQVRACASDSKCPFDQAKPNTTSELAHY